MPWSEIGGQMESSRVSVGMPWCPRRHPLLGLSAASCVLFRAFSTALELVRARLDGQQPPTEFETVGRLSRGSLASRFIGVSFGGSRHPRSRQGLVPHGPHGRRSGICVVRIKQSRAPVLRSGFGRSGPSLFRKNGCQEIIGTVATR